MESVEVPTSEDDQAQRGCGALTGPAPLSGKDVYVAPQPMDDEDDTDTVKHEVEKPKLPEIIVVQPSSLEEGLFDSDGDGSSCKTLEASATVDEKIVLTVVEKTESSASSSSASSSDKSPELKRYSSQPFISKMVNEYVVPKLDGEQTNPPE